MSFAKYERLVNYYHTEDILLVADNIEEAVQLGEIDENEALNKSLGFDRTGFALIFSTPEEAKKACAELSDQTLT